MANWYLEQSSGRYSVDGYVSDWVKVPFNEAPTAATTAAASSAPATSGASSSTRRNAWCDATQIAAGKTRRRSTRCLPSSTSGIATTTTATATSTSPTATSTTSSRSTPARARRPAAAPRAPTPSGAIARTPTCGALGVGPAVGGVPNPAGGIRDRLHQHLDRRLHDRARERRRRRVLARVRPRPRSAGRVRHQRQHRRRREQHRLVDPMSQGSYGTVNGVDLGIGAGRRERLGASSSPRLARTRRRATPASDASFKLGPAEHQHQAGPGLVVVLPDKKVTKDIGAPYRRQQVLLLGRGQQPRHDHDAGVTLPPGTVTLTAKAAGTSRRLGLRLPRGRRPTAVPPEPARHSSVDAQRTATSEGITGTRASWVDLTADLSAFAGGRYAIGSRYLTDGGVQGRRRGAPAGFSVDDIAITGQPTDGAETDPGWTFAELRPGLPHHDRDGDVRVLQRLHRRVPPLRRLRPGLKLGPYNFGIPTPANWVEHFPYQDGLLIWYYDTSLRRQQRRRPPRARA